MHLFRRRPPEGAGITVLVVDDEPHVTALVAGFLEKGGYETLAANDGQTALEHARSRHPDAIMLDLDMPGMSGWEVFEQLQVDGGTRSIPILLTSCKCINWGERLPPGVSAFLTKPFSSRELRRFVRAILAAPRPEHE